MNNPFEVIYLGLVASYYINDKKIKFEELKKIQITRKDYIDYIESLKKKIKISTINI